MVWRRIGMEIQNNINTGLTQNLDRSKVMAITGIDRVDPEWQNRPSGLRTRLQETKICACAGQIPRDSLGGSCGPLLRRQLHVVGPNYEVPGLVIANRPTSRRIGRPVHLLDEIAQDRICSTCVNEEQLMDLTRGHVLAVFLQESRRERFV